MEKIKCDKVSLNKFGITMGIAFLVITILVYLKHKHSVLPWVLFSAIFFTLGVIVPSVLKPVYIFWMRLAFVLGWINTRLLLIVLFYLIFAPIGIVMRLFGADLLDKRIDRKKDSYWHKKETAQQDYKRQF